MWSDYFIRWPKIFNLSFLTVEKRQWRTGQYTDLCHSNLGLLNNRALFDTAFDPQSCLQDLSRPFRCTVCIREKVLYASSTALASGFANHCYYDTPIAHCLEDGRRSQRSGGHFPSAWRFPPRARRHAEITKSTIVYVALLGYNRSLCALICYSRSFTSHLVCGSTFDHKIHNPQSITLGI